MLVPNSALVLGALCLALLGGCSVKDQPYELVRAGNQTFLLNKKTGESKLVDGTTLVPVKTPDTATTAAIVQKNWPKQTLAGVSNASVQARTKYRDGQMLYVITASPYDGPLGKAISSLNTYAAITVNLSDSDGFEVGQELDLKLISASRIVDNDAKPTHLQWSGSQTMSLEAYSAASMITVGWRGFPSQVKE